MKSLKEVITESLNENLDFAGMVTDIKTGRLRSSGRGTDMHFLKKTKFTIDDIWAQIEKTTIKKTIKNKAAAGKCYAFKDEDCIYLIDCQGVGEWTMDGPTVAIKVKTKTGRIELTTSSLGITGPWALQEYGDGECFEIPREIFDAAYTNN